MVPDINFDIYTISTFVILHFYYPLLPVRPNLRFDQIMLTSVPTNVDQNKCLQFRGLCKYK